MSYTANEMMEFVKENDVKLIRLGFCDLLGCQKNISIMAENLPSAFDSGVTFDAHAIQGFGDVIRSDLLLFPDPATLTVLPWRPGQGRVAQFYCDIKNPDGSPFALDGRSILRKIEEQYAKRGFFCKIGAECEFYLFKTDETGEPTLTPMDKGRYLDISPVDKGEDIRREICLTLEEMGITPETSHHEQGPGQNEIAFKFSDALKSADNFLTFKSVVKAVAERKGLFASFMPKPVPNAAGSGLHVNISISCNGMNIFKDTSCGKQSETVESFIAGIMSRTPEMTLFLNPLVNSYERFGKFEAPKYVSWSRYNRSQLVRIPAAMGDRVRMELRSPDPAVNPYLAFALILAAGLEGIENGLKLPDSVDEDLYNAPEDVTKDLDRLPGSIEEAILLAKSGEFVGKVVGKDLLQKYISLKEAEAAAFAAVDDKTIFYKEMYFDYI